MAGVRISLERTEEKPKAAATEPLSNGKFAMPIWVRSNQNQLRPLFDLLKSALQKKGYSCDADVQTDPCDGYKIIDFFEVRLHEAQKREPEVIAIVSLYANEAGHLLKVSPEFHWTQGIMASLLGDAIEVRAKEMGSLPGAGTRFEVLVSPKPSFNKD